MEFTNQLKKYIKSLHLTKYRQKYNKFIAEGPKTCYEFLESNKFKIECIVCTSEFAEASDIMLGAHLDKLYIVNDKVLQSISQLKSANKILIVFETSYTPSNTLSKREWYIYLDDLQNPGNVGTILRTADWFGISGVICSENTVDAFHPKVIQSAMGAHTRVKIYQENSDVLEALNTYVLDLSGESIVTFQPKEKGVIIVGNEGQGISPEIQASAGNYLNIPRVGGAESLNAAIACSIAAFQLTSKLK